MNVELDHVFICVSPEAPEAGCLIDFGLTEGAPNRHLGQGTANRRFFFENAMLELLWVDDLLEAQSASVSRTRLWQRWSARSGDASPFGIGFRPSSELTQAAPFEGWPYRPPYLPPSLSIHMAHDDRLCEPMWFYLPHSGRALAQADAQRQTPEHPRGFRKVTSVRVAGPGFHQPSATATLLAQAELVTARFGQEHLLELEFDGQRQGQFQDFRPRLPLLFRW